MRYPFSEHIRRSRIGTALAILTVVVSAIATSGAVQARVDPGIQTQQVGAQSQDTVAKATGGGTVLAFGAPDTTVSSFGFNARRPVGFAGGGFAEGRINYDRHRGTTDRHVNVPVIYMQATATNGSNTGGSASIIGNCAGQTCPSNTVQVLVYVEDNSDSGANSDVFKIFFCGLAQTTPLPDLSSGPPEGCSVEGGTLRSGNIQVRGEPGLVGESMGTAAGSGAFNSTPNVNGVELAGGTFGIGIRTAGPGDLEAQFNGINPVIGLFQQVTITGWITTATVNGSTMNLTGTAKVDMGDGSLPLSGLPLTGSISASGVTLTVGSWSLGTLPMSDGFIIIE